MSLRTGMVFVLLWTLPVTIARGQILRDDFDTSHNYATGSVPGGSIWNGVHNPTAGGTAFDANTTTPGSLTMGTELVGWGGGGLTASPMLFRNVESDQLREVRLRISAQSVGTWSMAGTIIRKPGPIDTVGANDNFATFAAFRVGAADTGAALGVNGMSATVQNVNNGGEAELNSTALNLTEADLTFLRLVHLGTGDFQTYASMDGTNWGEPIQTFTNGALAEGLVEVGLWGGNFPGGDIPGAMAAFDWVEIELGPDAPEALAIWDTAATFASWNRSTWVDAADNGLGIKPDSNISVAVFGDVLNDAMENVRLDPGTIYTNSNVTVKELRFETDISYTIGGAGSITLASNSGPALINVNEGTHEIQASLLLANNATATAVAGATLNINAGVDLDGNTLTLAGAGAINLNNGVITGGGQVNGAGSLAGLGGVVGDFFQAESGSLAVTAGEAPIVVTGAAELAGTLDVSLAEGLSLSKGHIYTILTAGSVSDLGVSLGAGASLFDLLVSANSISLVAAVPEPSTWYLFGLLGLIAVSGRRLREGFRRGLALIVFATAGFAVSVTTSFAQCPVDVCGIFVDEFDGATHDYTTGNVPAGGIWDGIWNPTNGGTNEVPAVLVSNGADFFGNPRPGVLFWEELALLPNTNGALGTGWEGNQTSAPFLYRNVPAENDFVATVKINSQTNGTWSYGGLIARHAGPTPGQTVGDPLDPEESFITFGSFRTTAADNPDTMEIDETQNFTVLRQNVINTAETEANGGGGNGIPTWIRMEKVGGQFTPSFSLDGVAFTTLAPQINPELNVAGEMLEVGPSFMTFGNGIQGEIEFDSFHIEVTLSPTPTMSNWSPLANGNGSGNWNNANNWTTDVPGVVPGAGSGNKVHVTLGDVLPGPSTIGVNDAFSVPKLTINSPNSYAISGSGSLTLAPNAESVAEPTLTRLEVNQGSHAIQVDLSIDPAAATSNNHFVVAPGAELNINNTFVMNNKQVLVSGGGRVNLNNNIDSGAGTLIVGGGSTVGGSGRVNGALTNGNATNPNGNVSPGTSIGTLTVDGTYNQHSSSTLHIELGGTTAGSFDVLAVNGLAILDGFVDVSLIDGFVPSVGNTFTFLTATTNIVDTNVIELVAADAPYYNLMRSGNTYQLQVTAVPPVGVPGDFNDDGVVNAADYVLWRNGGPLENDPTPGVQPGDYDFWVANFGNTGGAGTAAGAVTVPEPSSLTVALLFVAVSAVAIRKRR